MDSNIPFHRLAPRFRQQSTTSEELLWQSLRGRRCGGLKFRRQQPMGRFVVDFYCAERKLVVEIDGLIHEGQMSRDAEREALLEATGLHFLRFSSDQVVHDLPGVLRSIQGFA